MNHRFPVSNLLNGDNLSPESHGFEVSAGSYDDLTFTSPLIGVINWQSIGPNEILGSIAVQTKLELVCDRCLASYTYPVNLTYKQLFSREDVGDVAAKIDDREEIDILPSLLQEIQVRLPMKLLCRPDCSGIK